VCRNRAASVGNSFDLFDGNGSESQDKRGKAVNRNGYPSSEQNQEVKGAFGAARRLALDFLIFSEAKVAAAIDGAKRLSALKLPDQSRVELPEAGGSSDLCAGGDGGCF
jgi:hypothetical protein